MQKEKQIEKIKVIPLEGWMSFDLALEDEDMDLVPTERVFMKDGFYLVGDKCWFETGNKAFLRDKNDFVHALKSLNHKPLRDVEYERIGALLDTGYKSPELKKAWYEEYHHREVRRLRRSTIAFMLKPYDPEDSDQPSIPSLLEDEDVDHIPLPTIKQ